MLSDLFGESSIGTFACQTPYLLVFLPKGTLVNVMSWHNSVPYLGFILGVCLNDTRQPFSFLWVETREHLTHLGL